MTLQQQLTNLAQAIAADVKTLIAHLGNLSALTTTQKTSLVGAINELRSSLVGLIDDTAIAGNTTHTYSANKIIASLAALKNEIMGGAAAGYDTLIEIQNLLQGEDSAIANLLTAVGNRVRFDAVQNLTDTQKAQARSNIDAASTIEVGDTTHNFVTDYTTARDS